MIRVWDVQLDRAVVKHYQGFVRQALRMISIERVKNAASGQCGAGVIDEWARLTPKADAIIAPGRRSLSYAALRDKIADMAITLRSLGVRSSDRVATVLPNGPESAVAFLAVSSCAAAAPLNPNYSESEFDFYLSDLDAKALILPAGVASPALAIAEKRGISVLRLRPLTEGPAGLFELELEPKNAAIDASGAAREDLAREAPNAHDVALVLHTSGTTSRPKMVPLTHENLTASASAVVRALSLAASDRCLNVMPLFHIHGLVASVLSSLTAGGSVVCTPGFFATDFFGWIESMRPTWYTAVPTMHQAVLARAGAHRTNGGGHSLRCIRSSSAPLPPELAAQLEDVFGVPVIEAYGMTEAAHQMASNPLPPARRKPGSVGLAAGTQISVMNEDGDILPTGHTGEIVIRGPSVTSGYVGNPEANQSAFTDGWFRTGDRGYLDEDGYLFVTGRIKEIINRGGEKIAPREVDEVLLAHPGVMQAVAFAVPHPVLGEEVAAAVVVKGRPEVSERELRAFASVSLAPFKVPTRILFVDEIPKGPTGKLQRIGLARRLGLEAAPADVREKDSHTPPSTRVQKLLAGVWSDVLDVPNISIDAHFLDLGGDSMLATRLASRIREQAGIELTLIDLFDAPTVAQQAALVERMTVEGIDGR